MIYLGQIVYHGVSRSLKKLDKVNNSNSAFIFIYLLIRQGCQSGSIGHGGPGCPGGPSGPLVQMVRVYTVVKVVRVVSGVRGIRVVKVVRWPGGQVVGR